MSNFLKVFLSVSVTLMFYQSYLLTKRVEQLESARGTDYTEVVNFLAQQAGRSHWHYEDGTVHWEYDYPYCDEQTPMGQFCRKIGGQETYMQGSNGLIPCDKKCIQKAWGKGQ